MMNDPTELLDPLLREAKRVMGEMKKTQDPNLRKTQSEIVNNLCQCIGVFFEALSDAANTIPDFLEDDDDDDDGPERQGNKSPQMLF